LVIFDVKSILKKELEQRIWGFIGPYEEENLKLLFDL
jgi:hypothetical protein